MKNFIDKDLVNRDKSISVPSEKNMSKSDLKFGQWLAGLIDGDGYLGLSQKKYPTCEITVHIEEEKMLRIIQDKLGGSIRKRSGAQALRWRLSNRESMTKLIHIINGNIRNSKRIIQFNQVCEVLNIEPVFLDLTYDNNWISGFFDADGTIDYYYYGKRPQLFISISNKYRKDLEDIQKILGGKIYFDKGSGGSHKWVTTNENFHMVIFKYVVTDRHPTRSLKSQRIHMIPQFYKLYNMKAYKAGEDTTALFKAWKEFELKWRNREN